MAQRTFWTLNTLLVVFLTAAFAGLFIDLRYEHVDKVREHWTAWIPIIYSGIMFLLCLIGMYRWHHEGRVLLYWGFAVSLIVGIVGFWQHNGTHIPGKLATTLEAWTRTEHRADAPPTLAPLLFLGIGLLGMAACSTAFQQASRTSGAEKKNQGS